MQRSLAFFLTLLVVGTAVTFSLLYHAKTVVHVSPGRLHGPGRGALYELRLLRSRLKEGKRNRALRQGRVRAHALDRAVSSGRETTPPRSSGGGAAQRLGRFIADVGSNSL